MGLPRILYENGEYAVFKARIGYEVVRSHNGSGMRVAIIGSEGPQWFARACAEADKRANKMKNNPRRYNPGTFKIIYREEDYAGLPSDKPTPKGWETLRDGFDTLKDAQQFLHDEIDRIPEGHGLPSVRSLADDAFSRKYYLGRNPHRTKKNPSVPTTLKAAHGKGYEDGSDPSGMCGRHDIWPSKADFEKPNSLVRAYMRGFSEGLADDDSRRERKHGRDNPLPKSAPSRALLCIGQLRKLEVVNEGRTVNITTKNKWLAWDGKRFHICTVQGQVNATLPAAVANKHKKFHQSNPQGKPFLASMPSPGKGLKNIGLLKSLVYSVPSKINSPGKNKYLWHHAFGDTGHKGGDSYPEKVMPTLQRDDNGNLFIKRRKGNIFTVDQWLRG